MSKAQDMIDAAKAYVDSKAIRADDIMDAAIDAVEWAQWRGFDLSRPSPITTSTGFEPPEPPEPPGIVIHDLKDAAGFAPGTPPQLQDITSIVSESLGANPVNKAVKPTYVDPNKPNQLASFGGSAPSINTSFSVPQAPNWVAFSAPVLATYSIPSAPEVMLPSAPNVSLPDMPEAPTDLAGALRSNYREAAPQFITMVNGYVDDRLTKLNPQYHSQLARIEAQITKYLEGGTGLKAEVEDAIYARAQAKNDVEAQRVQNSALADMAARGFTMPNGVGNSMMARARQEAANNNAKAANEIAIAQAEMEQKNLQFSVTTSAGLRATMVSATMSYMQVLGQLNGQALDYSKSVVGAVVEAYNIVVRAYSTRLELVKTQVVVFDSQVKAAMSLVDLYRAKIAALQALTQIDQAKVATYTAQLGSMQALAAVYKSQVDAALAQVSMEKAKIDLFQAQVQSYGAEVQAKSAEWQGYSSAIAGEEAKMRGYNSEVQAFGAEVQAFSTLVSAKKASLDGAVSTNQARASNFSQKVESYRAIVGAHTAEMQGKVSAEAQKIAKYGLELQNVAAKFSHDEKKFNTDFEADKERYKVEWAGKVEKASLGMAHQNTLSQLHTANATIHGNLAGAALAGMNSLAVEYAES